MKTSFRHTDIEKDVVCPDCGYGKSKVFFASGPSGERECGECKRCGTLTYQTYITKNPNYVEPPTVTCPFCKSTDCKKISAASKIGKVALFGVLAAGSVSKTWHCNSCGSNFG